MKPEEQAAFEKTLWHPVKMRAVIEASFGRQLDSEETELYLTLRSWLLKRLFTELSKTRRAASVVPLEARIVTAPSDSVASAVGIIAAVVQVMEESVSSLVRSLDEEGASDG